MKTYALTDQQSINLTELKKLISPELSLGYGRKGLTVYGQQSQSDIDIITAHINEMTQVERDAANEIADYIKLATDALQTDIDKFAQSWGYDNIDSTAKYAANPLSVFHAEALLLIEYADAVWVYGLGLLSAWEQGGTKPAIDDIISGLPVKPIKP